jgi:hypothetical protein
MSGRASPGRARIAAERMGSRYGLDPITTAETGDKGKGSVLEIKRKGVVENARRTGGRGGPTFCPASFVEPGVHDLEPAAQPLRRHRYPKAHADTAARIKSHLNVLDSFE